MPKSINFIERRFVRFAIQMGHPWEVPPPYVKRGMWNNKAMLAYEFFEDLVRWEPLGKNPFLSHKQIFKLGISILVAVDMLVTIGVEETLTKKGIELVDEISAMGLTGKEALEEMFVQVEDIAVEVLGPYYDRLRQLVEGCQSPLEIAFLVGFLSVIPSAKYLPVLEGQHPIGKYSADFAFVDEKIVIEVDGHTYHEKTPEQAAKDRKRDRDLTKQGWRVFRFHRLEIEESLEDCVKQVFDFLQTQDIEE